MPRWRVIFWHCAGPASIVRSGFGWAFAAQGVAGEVDAMGVVDEAAYLRGDALERRAKMMQAWDDFCSRPMMPADVVTLRRA
jgi:hypothetical protein